MKEFVLLVLLIILAACSETPATSTPRQPSAKLDAPIINFKAFKAQVDEIVKKSDNVTIYYMKDKS